MACGAVWFATLYSSYIAVHMHGLLHDAVEHGVLVLCRRETMLIIIPSWKLTISAILTSVEGGVVPLLLPSDFYGVTNWIYSIMLF